MNNEPSRPDFGELEQRLCRRSSPAPTPLLRSRILRAVDTELSAVPASRFRIPFWSYAAALAAAAVVIINLSNSAAALTDFADGRRAPAGRMIARAEAIQSLAPDLSDSEARRMAALLSAGERLVPAPQLRGMAGSVSNTNSSMEQ